MNLLSKSYNYKVKFNPNKENLDEIEKWLIEEYKINGHGFYCNWGVIKSFFNTNNLVTISINNKTIGFIAWSIYEYNIARIEIAVIKPSERKKGAGRMLLMKFLSFLIKEKNYIIELECMPSTSEPIWKRLGFIEYSYDKKHVEINSGKELYKILIDTLPQSLLGKNSETIELWNNAPYNINENIGATYIWNLEFINNTRKLSKPIIHEVNNEWRIRWKKNNITIIDDKVKYFKHKIDFNSFIIIKELPINNL